MPITPDLHKPAKRERLLRTWHLLFIACTALAVLVLLAPSTHSLEHSFGRPDGLTLRYLRLLVAVQPNDVRLKLQLIQALLATGNFREASQILSSVSTQDPELRRWAARLSLQVHLAQFTDTADPKARDPELRQRLGQEIEALLAELLPADQLVGLAASSLIIGRPDLAGRIYLKLAEVDPEQRRKWLIAAAQQHEAAGQPGAAGLIYDLLVEIEPDREARRRYALLALHSLIGADQGKTALAFAVRYLSRFPGDQKVLEIAARMAQANGQIADAARYYEALANAAQDRAGQRSYALLHLLSLIASNQVDAALSAVRLRLTQFPGDSKFLNLGIELALGNSLPREAQAWGRLLLQQDPNSSTRIARQLRIELAVGDQAAALALARRLVHRHPHSVKQREQLAQLAEWNGQPELALAEWVHLALQTNKQSYLDRALKMAPQLYEMEQLAKLLAFMSRRGRLTNAELLSLIEIFESLARPEELVEILNDYLRRYSDHREAWQALVGVQERRGDLPRALAILERLGRDYGSDLPQLTQRAQLLWELRKPTQAYVLLRDALDHAGVATSHDLLTNIELARLRQAEPSREGTPEAGRQSFLLLLAQLFWLQGPRPELIEDYRRLWAAGALLTQSAGRYMYLAQQQGLKAEAISVGEAAFLRFKDPEFLLSAMEIAYESERWADLERLIAAAHERIELFSERSSYYLILAEYYTHQGEYQRAQAAYLRLLRLDPGSVAARAALLWLHIDHSEDLARQQGKRSRNMLERLLTNWRVIGEAQPSLWLPFATGWAMLGKSRDAVAFYKREWTSRPTDHLWLLGYVATLDAVSRSSDAHRLRRFALAELRPEAVRAAHPGASPIERELLKAYVELVRDVYGPGKGSRWLTEVLRSDLDPAVQKGLAAVWRSTGERLETHEWVADSRSVLRKNPWGRFRKSPKLGQDPTQANLTDAGAFPVDRSEPPPAPLLALSQDASPGEDRIPTRAQRISIETAVQTINDLLIASGSVSGLIARGVWALGGRLGVNQLFLNGADDPSAANTEVELQGYALWRHRLGRLEVGLGANLRADSNLFSGWANESFALWRGGTLQLGVHVNELALDTRWVRLYGARHRVTLGLNTSILTAGLLSLQANFFHYHTRTNEPLSAGVNADLELGYRIHRVRPLWTVRASASYTRNFLLTDQLPQLGGDSSSVQSILDALPREFAAVGIGTHVEHRFPGVAPIGPGRWRYLADVWVGWMWPLNIIGMEVRTGVSLGLPRKQEVSLTGFVANNRWLGPGVINAGLGLRYSFR